MTGIMQGSPPRRVPPREDWDRAPWNRWSFQHVRELVPTAEVWRGTGPVYDFATGPALPDDLTVPAVDGGETTLSRLLEDTYSDGFLVLKNGAIAYENYFGGMTPRTLHLSQSVAKSVTSAVVGILVGRGVLDVDGLVTDCLPELAQTGWKGARLQQVLDMTTGVRFSEDYTDPHSEMGQLDVACGWKPVPRDAAPGLRWPSHVWDLITDLKETTQPHGAAFAYRSIETDVLAFCMERVTGKRLPQLVSEELWQKMGAAESACFTVDPAGYALADGGFNACLRDYARFGLLLSRGGEGIVPAAWIAEARRGVCGTFSGRYELTLPRGGYHNQFWIEDDSSRSLLCRGVFGQLIYMNFETGVVAAKLSSWPEFVSPRLEIATLKAIHAIERHLG